MLTIIYDKFIREPWLMFKHYRFLEYKRNPSRQMIFCADGKFPHGGMFDRLKGAISVYAASKVLGREFRINFTSPFQLENYLEPNLYDWRVKEGEYTENILNDRMLFLYGELNNPDRLFKIYKRNLHVYFGANILPYIEKKYNISMDWKSLYDELFKPTAYLQQYIDAEKDKMGGKYIAIHLRFMNLLGDKTEFDCDPTLPADKQEKLMESGINEIKKIMSENPECKVMLATDSEKFVELVKSTMPEIYSIPGQIRHIGTACDNSDSSNIKMFLDYYIIAGASSVYSLVGPGMWKSAFPEYAAKIGGLQFQRISF